MYINKHLQIFILLIFSVVATAQETKKCPVDTLITKDDKYTGVVLFSDSTWTLVDLGRP
jgi:hypothetical protein